MTPPRPDPAGRSLEARKLIGDSFRLVFRNFGVLFPIALAPSLLIEALAIAVFPDGLDQAGALGPAAVFVSLASMAAGYLITAALCLVTVDILAGRQRPLAAYVSVSLRSLLPIVVVGVLLSIAVALGLIALIIPGLYISAQFFVWLPCIVIEGAGMASVGRAQALTRGHRWSIVGALLILGVFIVAMTLVMTPLLLATSESGGSGGVVTAFISAVFQAIVFAVFAVFTTLVYVRLRGFEDGTDPETLSRGVA